MKSSKESIFIKSSNESIFIKYTVNIYIRSHSAVCIYIYIKLNSLFCKDKIQSFYS